MPTSLDTYAPFDAGAGSNVTEATWRKFMRHMLGSASGVIRGFTNEFAVTGDGSGMNVKVATGECWVRGHYGESTAIKTLTIAAAHATLARKDRVVLRADFTNNRVELDVLTGTAAASPITPAVTQSTTIWETSLAVVSVAAAATSITATAGVVVDDRVYTSAQGRYSRTTAQATGALAYVQIAFGTTVTGSGDIQLDPATGTLTLLRAGLWTVSVSCAWVANATGKRDIIIARPQDVNVGAGTTTDILAGTSCPGVAGSNVSACCTGTGRYPAGTQIAAYSFQDSGGSLNINAGTSNNVSISIVWVGP